MTTSPKSRLAATLFLFFLGASLLSCSAGGPGESDPRISSTPDTTRPTVTTTTPSSNATNVATSASLTATFSEPVAPATLTATTFTLSPATTGNITVTDTTVTFAPTTALLSNTVYTATLTTDITDLAGNHLATPKTWSFTSGAAPNTTRPTVTTTTPSSNAANVATSASLTATFSKPMNAGTISPLTFKLRDSGNNPVAGTVTYTGTTATFTPGTPLINSTLYTASLEIGITDLAGNPLAATTWTFTTAIASTPDLGLDFPGSAAVPNGQTMRFKFPNPQNNGLPIYGPGGTGVTYIWRAYPRQQSGYYTAFFWGNDNGGDFNENFLWNNGSSDTFYGAHPYPDTQPNGSTHKWEIAAQGNDFVNGTVVYNRWYTQALRVWSDASGKHHEFYWDLPNTDPSHQVIVNLPASYGNLNPPVPALTWGDAPWNPSAEVWNGILRGIQIYTSKLSLPDILNEIASPTSTAAGINSIWYLNLNPTPTDIADKSGKGHNPEWVGNQRPMLYIAP